MGIYILKRIGLIFPPLFGIMVINFLIVQTAPGGPVEQIIAQLTGEETNATARITGGAGGDLGNTTGEFATYEGTRGLDPDFVKELEVQFGFDKPLHERFFMMMADYLVLDFGTSYFQDRSVISIVVERMPVSI